MKKTVYAVILCSALATGSSYSMGGDENSGGGIEATVAVLKAEIQELRGANDYLNARVTGLNGLLANVIANAGPAIELTVELVEDLTEWTADQDQVVLRVDDQTQELSRRMDEQKTVLQQEVAQERRDRVIRQQRDLRAQKNREKGLTERLDEQALNIKELKDGLYKSIADLLLLRSKHPNAQTLPALQRLWDLSDSLK